MFGYEQPKPQTSRSINIMGANVEGHNNIPINIKNHTQIRFDHNRVNRTTHEGREPLDFVSA